MGSPGGRAGRLMCIIVVISLPDRGISTQIYVSIYIYIFIYVYLIEYKRITNMT